MEKKVDFTRDVIMLAVVEKAGTFADAGRSVDYHNFVFTFCEPIPSYGADGDNVVTAAGAVPFEVKIKARDCNRIFNVKDFAVDFDPDTWIGDTYSITYDHTGPVLIARNLLMNSNPVK